MYISHSILNWDNFNCFFFLWICYKQKLSLRRTDAQGQTARASLRCNFQNLPTFAKIPWAKSYNIKLVLKSYMYFYSFIIHLLNVSFVRILNDTDLPINIINYLFSNSVLLEYKQYWFYYYILKALISLY